MPIAYVQTTAGNTTTSGSSLTFAVTIPSGTDQVLVVATGVECSSGQQANMPITGVTFNGDALTKIRHDAESNNRNRGELWYMVNPDVATGNVVITATGSNVGISGGALLYSGVDQSTPIDANSGTTVGASASNISTTISPTVTDAYIVYGCVNGSTASAASPGNGETETFDVNATSSHKGTGGYRVETTTGSKTVTINFSPNDSRMCLSLIALTPALGTIVTLQPDATAGLDTFISNFAATTNYGTSAELQVGESNADAAVQRGLLKFDLSSIPSGSTITSAILTLTLYHAGSFRASNNRTMYANRMKRAWVESEATWNIYSSGNNWATAGGGTNASDVDFTAFGNVAMTTSDADESEKSITLSASLVQEWLDGTFTNNGLMLSMGTESDDMYIFHSSDGATSSKRPKLVITYTSNTSISKFLGIVQANLKKIASITNANTKKLMGVANA